MKIIYNENFIFSREGLGSKHIIMIPKFEFYKLKRIKMIKPDDRLGCTLLSLSPTLSIPIRIGLIEELVLTSCNLVCNVIIDHVNNIEFKIEQYSVTDYLGSNHFDNRLCRLSIQKVSNFLLNFENKSRKLTDIKLIKMDVYIKKNLTIIATNYTLSLHDNFKESLLFARVEFLEFNTNFSVDPNTYLEFTKSMIYRICHKKKTTFTDIRYDRWYKNLKLIYRYKKKCEKEHFSIFNYIKEEEKEEFELRKQYLFIIFLLIFVTISAFMVILWVDLFYIKLKQFESLRKRIIMSKKPATGDTNLTVLSLMLQFELMNEKLKRPKLLNTSYEDECNPKRVASIHY